MRHIYFLALKLLIERKRQTIVSFLGVSIGVSAFVVMSSLMLGFQSYFIQQVIDLEPHIKIKPKESLEDSIKEKFSVILGLKPKEEEKILGWRDLMAKLEENSEVLGVAPHLVSRGIVRYGIKEKPVNLIGIDPEREPKASIIERFLKYKNLQAIQNRRDGVVLGALVAKGLGIKELGQKVLLVAPNGETLTLRVVDIFDSGITNLDDTRVYLNINVLQAILGKEGQVNEIIIKLRDPERAEKIAKTLSLSVDYEVESWQRAYKNFLSIFKIQNIITYMIVFAILLVSAFGIFNIIMMTVLEKKKDIAILMAMGYSRTDILLIFLFQGVFVGIIGAVLGSVIGYGLQEYLESIKLDVEGLIRTPGFVLYRSFSLYIYGAIFSILFSVFASLYPSYKASKLNPVDIFRSG
ncbi:ABC transporter permease [Thermocrinis sp.]|uniref:ABC transporter permease n=1 Tax=Thermocrinis sp. TaxID=2024383 RepID=UPI002FDE1260